MTYILCSEANNCTFMIILCFFFGLRKEDWAHIISSSPPPFIEVPVPSQRSKGSYICVLGVSTLPLYMISLLDFGTVLTVWYFLLFILSLSIVIQTTFSVTTPPTPLNGTYQKSLQI